MKFSTEELKDFLEKKTSLYNSPAFIESDPISIPHRFTKKEDIEISAFLSAVISWGNRKSIVANASRLMQMMDNRPHDFILHHSPAELKPLKKFVHRTFNGNDAVYFVCSLKNIYVNQGGLSGVFSEAKLKTRKSDTLSGVEAPAHFDFTQCDTNVNDTLAPHIHHLKKVFYSASSYRTTKHLPDPLANSSAKRINMFLRWMVRNDKRGVDFGLWNFINPAQLSIPLDLHSGNVARKLGLLKRKQSDWKAVSELTSRLRAFDANDPVKYDFALFGLGVFEKF